jgi:hypothetical protein
MSIHATLIDACFAASPKVRYVAAYLDGTLRLRSRNDLQALGSNESDRYEELIVNPTMLKLLTQRGNIDCGGLRHVVVRYGQFQCLVCPTPQGHVTVSLEHASRIDDEVPRLLETLESLTGLL